VRRALLVAALLLAACSSGQDPGVPTAPGDSSPATTSRALEACPPGGPDATTPAAGCLDEDGMVVHL
jgi:hypothetical protein